MWRGRAGYSRPSPGSRPAPCRCLRPRTTRFPPESRPTADPPLPRAGPDHGRRFLRSAWRFPETCDDPSVTPSKPVRLFREIVRQRARHAARIVHLDDVPRDEPREVVRVHAPRQVVPCRNGAESPCVVIEAGGLVDTRRLGGALAETRHPLEPIVEPPRRPEP